MIPSLCLKPLKSVTHMASVMPNLLVALVRQYNREYNLLMYLHRHNITEKRTILGPDLQNILQQSYDDTKVTADTTTDT